MTNRTRIATVATTLLMASMFVPIAASASEACNPDASGFCVDYSLAVSSSTAASPFDLDGSISNTSPGFGADTAKWLNSATISLTDGSVATPPTLTPSSQLADGLLLAGGTSCTAPTYATCAGGNGTLVANINSSGGSATGQTGNFGIEKIVNVNPPGAGNYAHYRATIRDCVTFTVSPGQCFQGADTVQDIVVADAAGGGSPPLVLTIVTRGSQSLNFGVFSGTADYSLSSFSLHLKGSTNQVDGASSLAQPQTAFALPKTCGTEAGSASFVSGDARTVSVPQSFQVNGCPTAVATSSVQGLSASFDGTGSTSPINGRSIAKWHWDFGDGGPQVATTSPTVNHDYATAGPKTATLVAEDSAGALSDPVSTQVNPQKRGTTMTIDAKTKGKKIDVTGKVKPATDGQVTVVLKGKKPTRVKSMKAKLTAGRFGAQFKTPKKSKKCKAVATYSGDASNGPSHAKVGFKC